MADETPEQIRERIHSEELAKGSDPRVAEGRAKAAELRARQGLPIDPEQAWRAKLEQEGGAPSAPAEAPTEKEAAEAPGAEEPAEAPAEEAPPEEATSAEAAGAQPPSTEAPVEEPEEAPRELPVPMPAAPDVQAPVPAGVEVQAPVPAGVEVQRESAEIAAVRVAPPAPVPSRDIEFEPEIGEVVELDIEEMAEIAGIKLADARLPSWLVAAFVALVAAAVVYLLVFSGPGAAEQASGCRVETDRTIVCGSTVGEQPAQSEEATP